MSVAAPVRESDRRVAARRQPAFGTVCRFGADAGAPTVGLVWNISESGVSMLVPRPQPSGATLSGELACENGGEPLPVKVQVVHVKTTPTGDYFIGARFDRPLTKTEMGPFLAVPSVETMNGNA